MSVAISWDNKMQLAKCDILVGLPISSHMYVLLYMLLNDETLFMLTPYEYYSLFIKQHWIYSNLTYIAVSC